MPEIFARARSLGARLSALPGAFFAPLALVACVHDAAPPPKLGMGSGGGHFAYSDTSDLVAVAAPAASSPGRFVTRSRAYSCAQSEIVLDTVADTTLYAVGKGVLNLWSQGDCLATRLTGPGSKLEASWSLEGQDSVARAWRPAECRARERVYSIPPSGEYVISREKVVFRTHGGLCLARLYADNLALVLDSVQVSTGCDAVSLGVAGGKAATMTSEMGEGVVNLRFTHGDTTCEGSVPLASSPPKSCPDTGLSALGECLTDFFLESWAGRPATAKGEGTAERRREAIRRAGAATRAR